MRSRTLAALVVVLLLAAWLRFYRIETQSYWNDEGNSLRLAERAPGAIWQAAAADIHPPGYYLILKGWLGLMGSSELGLRSLSALAGVALVALLYRLGREYFGPGAGVAAALAGAFNPLLVYYGQEARMYGLLATLAAGSFLLFSLWLRSSRGSRAWGNPVLGLAFSLVTAAGMYTHYAFGFVLVAQNVAAIGGLLAHGRRSTARGRPRTADHRTTRDGGRGAAVVSRAVPGRLAAWFAWQALAVLLYLPWLPTAWRQLAGWPAAREFQPLGSAVVDLGRYLAFGRTLPLGAAWGPLAGALVILLFAFVPRVGRRAQTITPLLWLVIPAALTLGFGLLSEAFAKFLLVAVPALCVLAGQGLAVGGTEVWERRGVRAGARHSARGQGRPGDAWLAAEAGVFVLWLGALGAVVYGTYASLNNLYFDPAYFRDDYRGIARYVAQVARPGDAVITISPNQVEAFSYYHTAGAPVYPLPHSRPPDRAATEAELAAMAAQHDRVFVLFWGEDQADPEHVVEGWLNAHAFKAADVWYGQVRLATYALATPAARPEVKLDARFGQEGRAPIRLIGYSIQPESVRPGDILQVTLFWEADAPIEQRYKVFVHLYTQASQPPPAQQDGEPAGGLRPTSSWSPGERIADNHGVALPEDLPPGRYIVAIGLYDLFDPMVRLAASADGEAAGDRLELTTINVEP